MRKTEEWLRQHIKTTGGSYTENGRRVTAEDLGAAPASKKKAGEPVLTLTQPQEILHNYAPAIGKRKKNKTEVRFERDFLVPAKVGGQLLDYKFERIKLILGDGTTYTPDFFGRWKNGVLQFWEIKGGYIYEDARVKFNVAAEQFPEFAFQLMQWKAGEWRKLKSVRC